jgi:hypothetical protein
VQQRVHPGRLPTVGLGWLCVAPPGLGGGEQGGQRGWFVQEKNMSMQQRCNYGKALLVVVVGGGQQRGDASTSQSAT